MGERSMSATLDAIKEIAESAVNDHETERLRLEMILRLATKALDNGGNPPSSG